MRTLVDLDQYIRRSTPRTDQALQLKKSWIHWYNGLSWHQRTLDEGAHRIGFDRLTAYDAVNGGSTMGAERTSRKTIRLGSSGDDVTAWQRIVGASPTSMFDQSTFLLTKDWQQNHGLKADGVVGPGTWAAVESTGPKLPLWESVRKYGWIVVAGLVGIGTAVGVDELQKRGKFKVFAR